jgi:outer membrane protein OmpA-like peptidoglycan-associated protein
VATIATAALIAVGAASAQAQDADETIQRTDYLTFAQGAIPVRIGGAGAALGADYEAAVLMVDGDPTPRGVVEGASDTTDTEFVYELPALTTFDRFAVPEVLEVPSPGTTFTRQVEVYGSPTSADDGFDLLASGTLTTHEKRGQFSELKMVSSLSVRWVKLRLVGGIEVLRDKSSFQFSEIIGNGTQELAEVAQGFSGTWRRSALTLRLEQDGPLISGCYESDGTLSGTVVGNVAYATGKASSTQVPSSFILSVAEDGSISGVRSSNGGPFRLHALPVVESGDPRMCGEPASPTIGCGSVIHGISFDFDSATIRPDSEPVLAALYEGLSGDVSASILIEGHTSSEGSDSYNQQLSERRASAVVDALILRGLARERISSAGIGEVRPIAPNTDESGRSLNRRVEVHCQ